ncbi:MAG TPA: ATP synthase F1 subunit delta [Gaiellaceae bacterium]|nr:ATP synthase F1 subunit delta [Gaiellaceae bacterium]
MAVAHRVYAEALLEAAKEANRLPRVREEFDAFAAGLAESDELRGFLRNPQVETETKLAALDDVLAGSDELFTNFVHLLAEKGRIAEAEDVHEEFGRLIAREERVLELELTTAVELSDKEAAKVVKQIEEASGRRVVATRTVDPDIIGGIVVQAGSVRADASVRGRLDQLREELINR